MMVDFDKIELDTEERELEDSFERGGWKSVKNLDAEIERYRNYAHAFSNRQARTANRER
jgi:hypothetical protein